MEFLVLYCIQYDCCITCEMLTVPASVPRTLHITGMSERDPLGGLLCAIARHLPLGTVLMCCMIRYVWMIISVGLS